MLEKIFWCLSHQPLPMVHSNDAWYFTTNHVVFSFENTHRIALKDKKHRRKNQNTVQSTPDQNFSCNHCDHACLFHISLISHEYACTWCGPPTWSWNRNDDDIYTYIMRMMIYALKWIGPQRDFLNYLFCSHKYFQLLVVISKTLLWQRKGRNMCKSKVYN